MRNIILTLLLAFITVNAMGQEKKDIYEKIAAQFEVYYNNENADSIFGMFADVMKNALPLDKTRETMQQVKTQTGRITKREFKKFENGTVAVYKTTFEKTTFALKISIDGSARINGLLFKPYTEDNGQPKTERNVTKMSLPFKGEWYVTWGGDTKELNYHVESEAQKNAFDILVKDEKGSSFKTDGKDNKDYYAFGKELIAPCDGEVVMAVDGIKDNKPGEMNPIFLTGNCIILKTAANEYLLFAHFRQHSVKVKEGQKVKRGEPLGQCGNSGNSSEPHLHFHIQNVEDMNKATGVKCYFDKIMVNGRLKTDYSPIQGDKIRND